jgi:hypothetical protein
MIQLVALFEEYPPVIQLFIISIIANLVLIASWIIMGFLLMRVPEARFFLGLTFKRGGQVLEGVNPAGGVKFYHVKADAGQGVLRGKNNLYIFIHRLLKLDPKTETGTSGSEADKTERELARGKKTYNELLQKRNILDGCGRVIYHALMGSSIGGTAKMIAETEKVRIKAIQGGQADPGLDWEALAKLIRKNSPEESVLITPFSVESLAEYVKVSYSPSDIQMAWDEGYLAGLGVKGKGGFNIWWLLIILGIILLVVAMITLTGGGTGGSQSIIPGLPGVK